MVFTKHDQDLRNSHLSNNNDIQRSSDFHLMCDIRPTTVLNHSLTVIEKKNDK